MSQVYTSVTCIRPVIANTFLLGSFDMSVFQNLQKSSMMQSTVSTLYLFIYLFIFNLFIWLILFNQ